MFSSNFDRKYPFNRLWPTNSSKSYLVDYEWATSQRQFQWDTDRQLLKWKNFVYEARPVSKEDYDNTPKWGCAEKMSFNIGEIQAYLSLVLKDKLR